MKVYRHSFQWQLFVLTVFIVGLSKAVFYVQPTGARGERFTLPQCHVCVTDALVDALLLWKEFELKFGHKLVYSKVRKILLLLPLAITL